MEMIRCSTSGTIFKNILNYVFFLIYHGIYDCSHYAIDERMKVIFVFFKSSIYNHLSNRVEKIES